jgi:hypothetical protein
MISAIKNKFKKNNSDLFDSIVHDLVKSECKFGMVCRYYLLSLIQKEKDILSEPYFNLKKNKKKEDYHVLGREFKDRKNFPKKNLNIFHKWIKNELKEKTIYKIIEDKKKKIGKSIPMH